MRGTRVEERTGEAGPNANTSSDLSQIAALAGMRGYAIYVVVAWHLYTSLRVTGWPPLNGDGAVPVRFFFILSGFCLAASLTRRPGVRGLLQFYVRRILRIHPAYAFALLFTFAASFFYVGALSESALYPGAASLTSSQASAGEVLRALRFPGITGNLMPTSWIIAIELVLSFVLPPMLFLARRTHWSLLLLVSSVPFFYPAAFTYHFKYAFFFALGIAIFIERHRVERFFAKRSAWSGTLLILLGYAGFIIPIPRENTFVLWLMSGVGLALVMVTAMHVRWMHRIMASPFMVFCGRISYSVYLLHWATLMTCLTLVREPVSPVGWAAMLVLCTALTYGLAFFFQRFIETPFARLSNRLTEWIATVRVPHPVKTRPIEESKVC